MSSAIQGQATAGQKVKRDMEVDCRQRLHLPRNKVITNLLLELLEDHLADPGILCEALIERSINVKCFGERQKVL